ncbi:type II toxin-antitoxin system VapC family toxin [Leptospira levettii]|uniref:type II toxin-antitoxin system VapC family toxin n=1 Tax=Leptospira levettii TaxID=2023178 RepID=UPI0014385DD5|nr:type II toxin-antitoxin system VapC family toxin [Leptospira levettii]
MRWLLDTNAIIYIQKGMVKESLPDNDVSLSIISRIELLSFPDLSSTDKSFLNDFLSNFDVVPLSLDVERVTIEMRTKHKLKIPDAIICASAIVSDSLLITNDRKLIQIPDLKVKSLELSL